MNKHMHMLLLARCHLRRILIYFVLLVGLFAVPWIIYPLPMTVEWPWLVNVLDVVLPDLPSNVVRLATVFPCLTTAVIVLLWALRRGLRSIGRAQHELALHGTPTGYGFHIWTKAAKWIVGLHWLVVTLVVVLLGVISVDFLPGAKGKDPMHRELMHQTRCRDVCESSCLTEGDVVPITIRSDRVNHTGIWLEAGAVYSLHSTATCRWQDKGIKALASGFSFDDNLLGLDRFWWAEWLRPLPQALWFQVVGRVGSNGPEFPVLGEKPSVPCCWKASQDGELNLLVNDTVLDNNTGTMTLELRRSGC